MKPDDFGYITPENLALFTDLYELTMMQGYHQRDHNPEATFDLFFRSLPKNRGYMISAGLPQVVSYLETLNFTPACLEYLENQGFRSEFLEYLDSFQFTGSVKAIPEGELVFENEPLIEVTAPLLQAQLFETLLINQVGFQSLIATKAARMRDLVNRHGSDQNLVDFGSRRAHGTDAGLKAARASYVGGFTGTSNVVAGQQFGIPIFGTMAHSWIESYESERAAFEGFVDLYGEDAVLLIDTYDTVNGARIAREVAEDFDVDIRGVRLDSGDLVKLSREVQDVVGDYGIFVSSGIDEYALKEFFDQGGVADGFGVGTSLVTSTDAPKVEGVYKLMAVGKGHEERPVMKLSSGKQTYPGRKTVRRVESGGRIEYDILGLHGEKLPGREVMQTIIEAGKRKGEPDDFPTIRDRVEDCLGSLPEEYRMIREPSDFEVRISDGLNEVTQKLKHDLEGRVTREQGTKTFYGEGKEGEK